MTDIKTNQYWLTAVADLIRFRHGEIDTATLAELYPDFNVRDGYLERGFKESIYITIPEGCPLHIIPKIAHAVEQEPNDINRVDECEICIAYQPAWEKFTRWSKLREICAEKKSIVFRMSAEDELWRYSGKPIIDIRYLLREGGHGDCDGYGIEDDTWLVGLLFEDGTWFREWYIEGED